MGNPVERSDQLAESVDVNRKTLLVCVVGVALIALAISLAVGDDDARGRSAGRAASAGPDCGVLWEQGFELEGVVGGRRSQAYFDRRSAPDAPARVSGIVRFPDERAGEALADTVIGLEGPLSDDHCVVQLTQHDGDAGGSVWRLRLDSLVRLTGTRRMPDGRTDDVVLDIVPETPCDVATEWRTFRSPQWPITFDYPTNWTLTEDADDITIECASIAGLATTRPSLTFERGRFPPGDVPPGAAPGAGTGDSFTEPYWFFRLAGDEWRVGPYDPEGGRDRAQYPSARRSLRHGMTVLQGVAGEHRLYRPGAGYLGPGAGITRYLFIVGGHWVSLDSAGEHSHDDDIGDDGGPVLLDGDRIGDRVVRSITAR